ncbi:hypothetical protein Mapa_003989 [Marchantia paleacea]|nr:hypothetical protein Mapa_003989 [Marchantia paleacea]
MASIIKRTLRYRNANLGYGEDQLLKVVQLWSQQSQALQCRRSSKVCLCRKMNKIIWKFPSSICGHWIILQITAPCQSDRRTKKLTCTTFERMRNLNVIMRVTGVWEQEI